jgi:hypothetical protein
MGSELCALFTWRLIPRDSSEVAERPETVSATPSPARYVHCHTFAEQRQHNSGISSSARARPRVSNRPYFNEDEGFILLSPARSCRGLLRVHSFVQRIGNSHAVHRGGLHMIPFHSSRTPKSLNITTTHRLSRACIKDGNCA